MNAEMCHLCIVYRTNFRNQEKPTFLVLEFVYWSYFEISSSFLLKIKTKNFPEIFVWNFIGTRALVINQPWVETNSFFVTKNGKICT